MSPAFLKDKLSTVFEARQADVLADVITESYSQLVKTSDFSELKAIVARLAQTQERTEIKLEKLTERVDNLAQAQERTEIKVRELAEAQERTEIKLEKLTERVDDLAVSMEKGFQKSSERMDKIEEAMQIGFQKSNERMDRIEEAMEKANVRMDRIESAMEKGFQKVNDQISALGSRWGILNENTIRNTVRALMEKAGYTVERGSYGGREVDLVIRNGEHILLEITSSAVKKDIQNLNKSAEDYFQKTGVEPRLMIAAVYIPPSVMREITDSPRYIEVFSSEEEEIP